MPYEIRIRLIIENPTPGFLEFDQVERSLGLGPPARTWKAGDFLDVRSDRRRKNDGMLYQFFEGSNSDPVQEASRLIDKLEAGGDAAHLILRENACELSIVLRLLSGGDNSPMDTPPFHLPRSIIEKLHRFQLNLDIDLYVFCSE
jgi:hypothetical protein